LNAGGRSVKKPQIDNRKGGGPAFSAGEWGGGKKKKKNPTAEWGRETDGRKESTGVECTVGGV